MRLDFNVLWVDDQPKGIDAQIKAISKRMEDEGFQFRPTLCGSIEDVRKWVAEHVYADEIDLVLVDWDLGGGVEGQDAIAAIRDAVFYKDVVFYSARNPANVLRDLAHSRGLEGVYCASREELVTEVQGVFESLVKKVLDLDHTRGIVMGATSDIEDMVDKCLAAIDTCSDPGRKEEFLRQALGYVQRRVENITATLETMRSAKSLQELFEERSLFTAYDRLRILADALKAETFEAHKTFRKAVVAYQQDVVPKRNVLGHAARVLEGKTYVLKDTKGTVYTLETTRQLRRLILGLRADFRNLMTALQADVMPSSPGPRPGNRK